MSDIKIFRKAIDIYSSNYEEIISNEIGAGTALGYISKVINSIKNRNSNETEKKLELNNFKNYVVKSSNNSQVRKILNVKKDVFLIIYNCIFNNNTSSLNLDKLSLLCGYMKRLIKSKITDIDITYGLKEEINADKERALIAKKELEKQKELEKEKEKKALEAMSPEDRFKYEFENANDKEKFATEEYNLIISHSEDDNIKVKAKILLEFYLGKTKKSKKVLKKIDKLKEIFL